MKLIKKKVNKLLLIFKTIKFKIYRVLKIIKALEVLNNLKVNKRPRIQVKTMIIKVHSNN